MLLFVSVSLTMLGDMSFIIIYYYLEVYSKISPLFYCAHVETAWKHMKFTNIYICKSKSKRRENFHGTHLLPLVKNKCLMGLLIH